jgi:hypothetical protein
MKAIKINKIRSNTIIMVLIPYIEFYVNLLEYCRDHSGSRMVQKRFEESNDEEKYVMIEILNPHIYQLAKDVFGNYVIQKILENQEGRSVIIHQLEGFIYELSLHMYGCRVIQKAIELADNKDNIKIYNEVQHGLIKFIDDQNGNHVLQRLIERLSHDYKRRIVCGLMDKVYITYIDHVFMSSSIRM